MIPGMSDPADHARRPSNTPAANTMGTIPSEAQALVRCNARKKNAAVRPHSHCLDVKLWWRNALARAARDALGGPPPRAHHRKSARNNASIIAASCTPKFRSNSSQTLAVAAAIRKPATMALSVMGNFVQRMRPGVVIVGTSEERRVESYTLGLHIFAVHQC